MRWQRLKVRKDLRYSSMSVIFLQFSRVSLFSASIASLMRRMSSFWTRISSRTEFCAARAVVCAAITVPSRPMAVVVLVFTRPMFSFKVALAVSVSRRSVSVHEPCVLRSRIT